MLLRGRWGLSFAKTTSIYRNTEMVSDCDKNLTRKTVLCKPFIAIRKLLDSAIKKWRNLIAIRGEFHIAIIEVDITRNDAAFLSQF